MGNSQILMNEELLKYANANGMIDLSYVQEQVEMNNSQSLKKGYVQQFDYQIIKSNHTIIAGTLDFTGFEALH